MLKLIYLILSLNITHASQVLQVPLDLPGPQGVIVVKWTPQLARLPVFNHFLNAPGRVLLRNHYVTYSQPVLELSIGAVHHVRSVPVQYIFAQDHQIIAWWRHVGTMFEAGVMLDGRIVGYLFEPARPYNTWTAGTWVGGRDWTPVSDVTFPGCQHVDGVMSLWVWR